MNKCKICNEDLQKDMPDLEYCSTACFEHEMIINNKKKDKKEFIIFSIIFLLFIICILIY